MKSQAPVSEAEKEPHRPKGVASGARQAVGVGGAKTRVAILVSAGELRGWQKIIVESLRESEELEVSLYADGGEETRRPPSLWSLFERIEKKTIGRAIVGKFTRKKGPFAQFIRQADVKADYAVHGIGCLLGSRQHFAGGDAEAAGPPADLVLSLAAAPAVLEKLREAGFEFWCLRTERHAYKGGVPFALKEFLNKEPLCGIALTRNGEVRTFASGRYCAYLWSWSANSSFMAVKAALLIRDSIRKRRALDAARDLAELQEPVTVGAGTLSPLFSLAAMAKLFCRNLWHLAERFLREDYWTLNFFEASAGLRSFRKVGEIGSTRGSYFADPFLFEREGKRYVFCEEYIYSKKKGVLSCIELSQTAAPAEGIKIHPVVELDRHLSYPFMLQQQETSYMIPDDNSSGGVELWRCDGFPGEWSRVATLIAGVSAADSSLLRHQGKWWLFTNIDRSGLGDHRDELHAYFADDLLTENWQAHPLNPLVTDAGRARMAGGFISLPDGTVLRCGQVQGERYGMGVTYSEVETLTETDYAERSGSSLFEIPDLKGTRHHHVCLLGSLVVADSCVRGWKLWRVIRSKVS